MRAEQGAKHFAPPLFSIFKVQVLRCFSPSEIAAAGAIRKRHILANYFESKVINPGVTSTAEHDSKGDVYAFGGNVQNDIVLGPVGCALDLSSAKIVKGERA
ncbi:MAG: hypothetical protein HC888_16580, partial [Candidatus Competibacteraceae bacterium]|nr:hypothetical protein [Candidatus Competibacteraceae bacterium]